METRTLPTWQDQHWDDVATVYRQLYKAVTGSKNGRQMVEDDVDFLMYLWKNDITLEARLAVIDVLQQALPNVQHSFAKRKGSKRGAPRELLQLIPTTYNLFKAARGANPDQPWTIQLPQKIFEQGIGDLVNATRAHDERSSSYQWSKRIRASYIFNEFKAFEVQQQVLLLDFTHTQSTKIDKEFKKVKESTKKLNNFARYYPEVSDYERELKAISPHVHPVGLPAAGNALYHGVATAAVTGGPFQAQQRDSGNVMVFASNTSTSRNGTLPPPHSFAYGITNHLGSLQPSPPFNFATYPGVSQQQGLPHHPVIAQSSIFDPNSIATLPLRSFPTQGADPYNPSPHNASAALHPSYASSLHLPTYSNAPPQQLAFNPNFVQHAQTHYTAPYLAPEPYHNSYSVPPHLSSTHPQSSHRSTRDSSNYSSYPSNSQIPPPSNPHTYPRHSRHR